MSLQNWSNYLLTNTQKCDIVQKDVGKMFQDNDVLTVKQAADVLHFNPYTIYRWIEKGWLKPITYPSGGLRIPYWELKRYLPTEQTS
jgi:excisionase family DNA binding protein